MNGLQARVHTEQVRSVYDQSPTTTIGSLIVGLVLVLVMWGHVSKPVLAVWSLALCVHQSIRVAQYLSYRKASPADQALPRWGRFYTASAVSAGCIWGSAGLLMFVPDSLIHQAVLLLVLSGIAVVAIVGLSAYAPALYLVPTLTLVPFLVRLLFEGFSAHLIFAAPGLLVLVIAVIFGRHLHLLIAEAFSKRFENIDLIEKLRAQTKELSAQTLAAERAQQEAQLANRAKSEFFRAANHDLRQPLHALGIFGHALRDDIARERISSAKLRTTVEQLNASIRALETLMNELLDISRLDEGRVVPKVEAFPLNALLEGIQRDFKPEADAKKLALTVIGSSVVVRSDPILLERILRNLVANAVRYTREGRVLVGCRRHGGKVRLEVWDTGIGIHEHERERIFEEFYQAGNRERHSQRGMGLGLATVRRLAELLKHPVELVSTLGRGSMFRVTVPRCEVPVPDSITGPEKAAPQGAMAGKVIMVVDDEPLILEAMINLLAGWGCEIVAEESLDAALESLGRLSRYPDLMIVDYRLQDRVTGFDVIERVSSELGMRIPAIVITGSVTPELEKEATACGSTLVRKPLLPDDLQRVMMQRLGWQAIH